MQHIIQGISLSLSLSFSGVPELELAKFLCLKLMITGLVEHAHPLSYDNSFL
jgi:hypothetical protein